MLVSLFIVRNKRNTHALQRTMMAQTQKSEKHCYRITCARYTNQFVSRTTSRHSSFQKPVMAGNRTQPPSPHGTCSCPFSTNALQSSSCQTLAVSTNGGSHIPKRSADSVLPPLSQRLRFFAHSSLVCPSWPHFQHLTSFTLLPLPPKSSSCVRPPLPLPLPVTDTSNDFALRSAVSSSFDAVRSKSKRSLSLAISSSHFCLDKQSSQNV